jgi:hypothetical protein
MVSSYENNVQGPEREHWTAATNETLCLQRCTTPSFVWNEPWQGKNPRHQSTELSVDST